jgi:hypothetical protein
MMLLEAIMSFVEFLSPGLNAYTHLRFGTAFALNVCWALVVSF